MIRKTIIPLLVITGTIAVTTVVIGITLLISFIRNPIFTMPPAQLDNGGIVYITESRTFNIYLEDTSPPYLRSHRFVFVNTETQARIYSRVPYRSSTYEIGVVRVNNVPTRGRFGSQVAIVDLEAGRYAIEFEPWHGSGVFVWGFDMFGVSVRFAIQTVVLGIIFFASVAGFFILYSKRASKSPNSAYYHPSQ